MNNNSRIPWDMASNELIESRARASHRRVVRSREIREHAQRCLGALSFVRSGSMGEFMLYADVPKKLVAEVSEWLAQAGLHQIRLASDSGPGYSIVESSNGHSRFYFEVDAVKILAVTKICSKALDDAAQHFSLKRPETLEPVGVGAQPQPEGGLESNATALGRAQPNYEKKRSAERILSQRPYQFIWNSEEKTLQMIVPADSQSALSLMEPLAKLGITCFKTQDVPDLTGMNACHIEFKEFHEAREDACYVATFSDKAQKTLIESGIRSKALDAAAEAMQLKRPLRTKEDGHGR